MNIQDEVAKIHAKYSTTEMANYKIQILFESEIDKAIKDNNEIWAKRREETARAREEIAICFMLRYYVDEEHTEKSEQDAIADYRIRGYRLRSQ